MYETEDTLTAAQMKIFTNIIDDKIGVDYEVNPSASGEPDQFYCLVIDLETNAEYKIAQEAEKTALKG